MPLFSPEAQQKVLSQLVGHFWEDYPKETVGVILSDQSVLRFYNWSRKPHRFLIFPITLIWNLGWRAYSRGEGIALIYHSHRHSSSPSESDQAFMQSIKPRWPHVDHLIFTPEGSFQVWEA